MIGLTLINPAPFNIFSLLSAKNNVNQTKPRLLPRFLFVRYVMLFSSRFYESIPLAFNPKSRFIIIVSDPRECYLQIRLYPVANVKKIHLDPDHDRVKTSINE